MDESLRRLAESNGGVVTTHDARRCGLDRQALRALVDSGQLAWLGRSMYAVCPLPSDPVEAYVVRCRAALRAYPDAQLAGVSAIACAGLPVWGVSLARVELLRPVDVEVLTRVCRIRPFYASTVALTPQSTGASLARDVVQVALDAGPIPAVVAADRALHTGRFSLDDLNEATDRVERWPRRSRARTMLALADGASESVGESRCRVLLVSLGFDVESQVEVHDRGGRLVARADFRITSSRVLVEFDGHVKYASGDPQVLWAEKRREDRLRALGFVVVRITWADLDHPGRVAARIRAALSIAS